MASILMPLTLEQGSTFTLGLQLLLDGQPFSLTGYSARMQIRAEQAPTSELYFDLTQGNGCDLDPDAGTVDIELSAPRTAAFTPPSGKPRFLREGRSVIQLGYYNIELYSDDDEQRFFEGPIYFSAEVIP